MAKILAIEPWFGETHRLFLENWKKYSHHDIRLLTLPPRKWKWRMRAGSLLLIEQIRASNFNFDALLVSGYVNLAELIGLAPHLFINKFYCSYFHENQLTYPVQKKSERDYSFTLANMLTMSASHKIIWNSLFQRDDFLATLPSFINIFPEPRPAQSDRMVRDKSIVIPVGLEFDEIDHARQNRMDRSGKCLRILWPHRWEHDKNPDDFFRILFELADEGLPFELTILGKSYSEIPPIFQLAKTKLAEHIVQFGFVEAQRYPTEIAACDVVVSTARHENQGLAVIEAIRAGCDPLLPHRLAYPEILTSDLHQKHLYPNSGELRRILRWMMMHPDRVRHQSHHQAVQQFDIRVTAKQLDTLFD